MKNNWVILIPFTTKEINQLINNLKKILEITDPFWGKPDLLLVFHKNWQNLDNTEEITDILNQLKNKIFDKTDLEYANLAEEDDIYEPNINHSGPNNFFFKIIEIVNKKDYSKMTLLETDCEFIKPDWLENLYDEQHNMSLKDWICGTPTYFPNFKNTDIKTTALIKHHLNGNATYNLTHPFFQEVINKLKEKSKKDFEKGFVISYDVGFLKFFLDHKYQFYKNIQVSKCICSCCPFDWAKEKGFSIIHKPIK